MEILSKCQETNDYTSGNLLDYLYHQKYYKLIRIDLQRQTNASISQQIIFTGKLEEGNAAKMFLSLKSSKKYFKLFFRFIKCKFHLTKQELIFIKVDFL